MQCSKHLVTPTDLRSYTSVRGGLNNLQPTPLQVLIVFNKTGTSHGKSTLDGNSVKNKFISVEFYILITVHLHLVESKNFLNSFIYLFIFSNLTIIFQRLSVKAEVRCEYTNELFRSKEHELVFYTASHDNVKITLCRAS